MPIEGYRESGGEGDARLREAWNHNIHYHEIVLRAAPLGCVHALDVGCGTGLLSRRLAERCERVTGIDVDRDSLLRARAATGVAGRVEFVEGDVMSADLGAERFDLITAVASLHHLPLRPALVRFRELLRPGGVLAVVGLYRAESLADAMTAIAAVPVSRSLAWIRGRERMDAPIVDPMETLREIREACGSVLAGNVFRRLLLFRYSMVWRKDSQTAAVGKIAAGETSAIFLTE